jgi:hypothetical protein
VSSKSKKLNSSEIAAFEAKRDIGAEILQSLKDMKAGKGKVVVSSATEGNIDEINFLISFNIFCVSFGYDLI